MNFTTYIRLKSSPGLTLLHSNRVAGSHPVIDTNMYIINPVSKTLVTTMVSFRVKNTVTFPVNALFRVTHFKYSRSEIFE